MILETATYENKQTTVVVSGLKAVPWKVLLRRSDSPREIEVFKLEVDGSSSRLAPELLASIKPEIQKWLDGVLPRRIQDFASQLGAHVRVTKQQDDALLLLGMIREKVWPPG